MGFKRILCAVDFSDESIAALDRAAEIARGSGARLRIFHSTEVQPVYSGWTLEDQLGEITVQMEEKAKNAMDSVLDSEVLDGLEVETEIGTGRAFWEIVREAKDWQADLIVLGAIGQAGLEQYMVGSTPERVLKTAHCSVLIVRA